MPDVLGRLRQALSHRYRIERELGAGGMAVVYLAEDVKHHRPVALKVLRPELSVLLGPARFLREIDLAGRLTHPHILPLHDSGNAHGLLYYTMPYVEGEALRDRLAREGTLPLGEVIQLGREVADALAYAHAHGVVHRDIKPGNILLEAGHAVVTDFGIARAIDHAGTQELTQTGLAVGTPAYMSPEQAAGSQDLDGRSDLYSLGCVLYEALAGQPPFTGPTPEAVIRQHRTGAPPPLGEKRADVPAALADAVARALEREPADRYDTAGEFRAVLDALVTPSAGLPAVLGAGRPPSVLRRRARRRLAAAGVVAGAAAIALAGWAALRAPAHGAAPSRPSVLALPLTQPVVDAPGLTFALSPDGSSFVYVGQSATHQELFLRGMGSMQATAIPGTEGASTPFFSPDGRWVGFVSGGKIRKVPARGGPVETVSDSGAVRGASWGEDGIVFAPSSGSGLMRVPAAGGAPVVLTLPDSAHGETGHRWPEWLPGGGAVLFTSWRGDLRSAEAAVLDLRTGVVRRLGPGVGVRYSATGHLVFAAADGRLLARPFDRGTLQVSDSAVEVLRSVRLDGGPAFAVGPGGTIIYMPAETAERAVDWVDRAGRSAPALDARRVYSDPRLSPDGSRLAVTIRQEGAADIWVYAFAAGTLTRLTRGAESLYPVWSPDGRTIAFCSNHRRTLDLYAVPADGSREPTLLFAGPGDKMPDSWSPDGRTLFFRGTSPATGRDIWALRMDGARPQAAPVLATTADERSAMISPDGRWLAFTSDESGADQVYVRAWLGPPARWQVSVDGGTEPLWSRDGRELFYRAGDRLFAAALQTDRGFRVVSRTALFATRQMANPFRTNYDVARDGRRFIVIRSGEATAQLVALMNGLAPARR